MDTKPVDNPHSVASSSNMVNDEAEGIWSADIEQSFLEALAIYPPCGRRKIILTEEGKMYGRNELVARYIKIRTGKTRTRKQVSSHLQVLAKRRSKELQMLRNDKAAQQVILERLKRYTSAEIVSMDHEHVTSDDSSINEKPNEHKQPTSSSPIQNLLQPVSTSTTKNFEQICTTKDDVILPFNHQSLSTQNSPSIKKGPTKKTSTNNKTNIPIARPMNKSIPPILPTSPIVYHHDLIRSRCSSNTSSSSPLSSTSTGSQNIMIIPNPPAMVFPAVIGDENFRLHEMNAFIEIRATIPPNPLSLIYPTPENYHFYQQDLLRLHSNDLQMKTNQSFETISIDQIFDKFPRRDGLKDLSESNPDGPFFLIKFWADVLMPTPIGKLDELFFTTYSYIGASNRPIHISTRLCSFGRQVLEKVDTSQHPQRDQFDHYIHRFDRSALCDYMVQFIQKLRSLPSTFMMNSVLENFTILQVIKYLDNPEQLLLCLAFVFEIATADTGGPQYQIYKLVSH